MKSRSNIGTLPKIGITFSKPLNFADPFSTLGAKRPVYEELLILCQRKGWETYVISTTTYEGNGIFDGGWKFSKDAKLELFSERIKLDLVYDRSGGLNFPPIKDSLRVIDSRKFKELAWDKWKAYREIEDNMPKTLWVGEKKSLPGVLAKINSEFVVLKPINGLKGKGVFIGPKDSALDFEFLPQKTNYIAQEYVDTSEGISGIVSGLHDLRVVVINKRIVWAHVRTPPPGSYRANVARGGQLTEIAAEKIPNKIKLITQKIANGLYLRYDNPVFSLDFGVGKDSKPYLFELNDQIGFPMPEMIAKDTFLKELIRNFASKIKI